NPDGVGPGRTSRNPGHSWNAALLRRARAMSRSPTGRFRRAHRIAGMATAELGRRSVPVPPGERRRLDRVLVVDEQVLDAEALGDVTAQRLHAVAFGGVVAGREIDDARFAREMGRALGDLSAHVG